VIRTARETAATAQPGNRYVVERCAGGGDRAVYAVVDLDRCPPHRTICRTSYSDANMILDALNLTIAVESWLTR
jgi:hypothetical protein